MSSNHFALNTSLWICGESTWSASVGNRVDIDALRARGAEVFMLKGHDDRDGLEQLRRRLWQTDVHAVLIWLLPREMLAVHSILRERKNYSVMLDDWWTVPYQVIRDAECKIFRKYNGIAVRLGQAGLVDESVPWLSQPEPLSRFFVAASLLRLPALAAWPLANLRKRFQRRAENVQPEKLLYLPFPISADTLPLKPEKPKYDFAITGSTFGVWLMRDAFASFKHSYANLYCDRQRLMNLLTRFDGKPFSIYDWRRLNPARPPRAWEDYLQITRQSRYVVASGGLHNANVPKFLEYACVGTPMIGRGLPFEYPWLDECLFPVDAMQITSNQFKPLMNEAIERQPKLRENCLKWRDRLFELYNIHRLLDMLQAQADGKPIPPGYLKPAALQKKLPPQKTN
jgi:hypothetical protein